MGAVTRISNKDLNHQERLKALKWRSGHFGHIIHANITRTFAVKYFEDDYCSVFMLTRISNDAELCWIHILTSGKSCWDGPVQRVGFKQILFYLPPHDIGWAVSSQWKRHAVWAGMWFFGHFVARFPNLAHLLYKLIASYCNLSKCAQTRGCPYCQSVGSSNNSRSTGCATYFILIPSTSSHHSCVTCGTAPSLAAFLAERGYATPAFWVDLWVNLPTNWRMGGSLGGFPWGMVSSFQMWRLSSRFPFFGVSGVPGSQCSCQ